MMLMSRPKPFSLPDLDMAEIAAIKNVALGEADEIQQKRAIEAIIKKLCGIGGISMHEDPHITAFLEGKRMIGAQLIHLAETPMEKLKPKEPIRESR